MVQGAATVTIGRPLGVVFEAISDVTRMGAWSPECVGGRWVPPATTAAIGARFEGDNVAKVGPIPVKKWTTTSEVSAYVPDHLFEFTSAGYTRWRYELVEIEGGTRITESFQHEPYEGLQKFLYSRLFNRHKAMVAGMERTLERLKQALEVQH